MAQLAPIILFVYKRPRHALAALESLRSNPQASGSHLVIHCDGPKDASEETAVTEVRRVVRLRRWCGTVEIVERDINIGLARSVSSGVTEMLRQHERVIVLEDDLVLSPSFLEFMNDALARYEGIEPVMQVSGYMFPAAFPAGLDACFLPMISSWGWATWTRAWRHYDPTMSAFARLSASKKKRRRFDLGGSYPFFDLLRDQCAGRVDSWGIRWYLSVFARHGLTLFPIRSHVRNQGWDGSGTHCGTDDFYDTPLATSRVTNFPAEPVVTWTAYRALQRYFRGRRLPTSPSLVRRVLARLKACLPLATRECS